MATIEQILQDTMKIFETQAKEAVEAALSKAYDEYLPHVENDCYFNVRQQAREWLKRFMSDTLRDEDLQLSLEFVGDYKSRAVRQKIYEENKVEIQEVIGVDLQEEIDTLKSELQQAYRSY